MAAGADSTMYEKGKLYEINLNELLADPRNPGRAGGGRLLNRSTMTMEAKVIYKEKC